MTELEQLMHELRRFVSEREWARFHTPKNLAISVSVEAAELLEQFQWLTAEESEALDVERRSAVSEELADVLIYLLMLSDRLGIDPIEATRQKVRQNSERYPAGEVRGSAAKRP